MCSLNAMVLACGVPPEIDAPEEEKLEYARKLIAYKTEAESKEWQQKMKQKLREAKKERRHK